MNPKTSSDPSAAKWARPPLKSSWFDDHVGWDATHRERVENRVRNFEARFVRNDEEGVASREIERFFDLFEPRGG